MSFFPTIFVSLPFSLRMESTSYVSPVRLVFFHLVATGWIFHISACKNSIDQHFNQATLLANDRWSSGSKYL